MFIRLLVVALFCALASGAENVTTTVKPSSTTVITTTAAPVTTTAPETPKFPNNIGNWNVTNPKTNVTCIMLKSAMQISVNYTQGVNKTAIGHVNIPMDAKSSGRCGDKIQSLTLTWADDNFVNFTFDSSISNSTSNFTLKNVNIKIQKDKKMFINATDPAKPFEYNFGENVTGFVDVPLNKSFKCTADTKITSGVLGTPFTMKFEHAQIEAFRTIPMNNTKFSEEFVCSGDAIGVPSIVAGVVVAILVILLALLGIGYAVFHFVVKPRRANAGGYQNMQ